MSTELIALEKMTPATIFAPGGVDAILEKIRTEVRRTPVDISTKAGREHVASVAYKVARSKTALDKMGKDLGDANYKAWKAITAERSKIEKELDDLRDEVRKPLTEWENAEKDRITAHETALIAIEDMGRFDTPPTAADIKCRLDALICLPPREWQEFAKRAADAEQCVIAALNGMFEEATKREAEAADLARLRAEEIARQQKERDGRIAAEAAERARVEAEQKAAREAEAAARAAEAERKAAAAKAERDARDAAEAAERRQAAAIEAERKRVADEHAREQAEIAKRNANTAHKSRINTEVLAALIAVGLEAPLGKAVITAIVKGEVPHTKIEY